MDTLEQNTTILKERCIIVMSSWLMVTTKETDEEQTIQGETIGKDVEG